MSSSRINPTLFDKLVADVTIDGLVDGGDSQASEEARRSGIRFYTVPKIERFNEASLRATVMRELSWLLNTTSLDSLKDLDAYPQVKTSVLNYGVRDVSGRVISQRVIQDRAKQIRDSIRAFEPRLDPRSLEVEAVSRIERENAVTYIIRGDVTAAVNALPVEFKTDVELDTSTVILRE